MWVKTDNGVDDLDSGRSFTVEYVDDTFGHRTWEVVTRNNNRARRALKGGYTTENEARAALDEFLAANNITAVALAEPNDADAEAEAEAVTDGDRGSEVGKGA